MLDILGVVAALLVALYLACAFATRPIYRVADSMRPHTVTTVRPALLRRTGIKTYLVLMIVLVITAAGLFGALISLML